jgi:pyridoxal phosphate enzyme (YggS family)
MSKICENIKSIQKKIGTAQLVVVSKFRSLEELNQVYDCGIRDMAENRVQELVSKKEVLPSDIKWHLIGHLQKNKVKYIAPFIHLIHSVDSIELLRVINKEAKKYNRNIPFLFQLHVAKEESKFGIQPENFEKILQQYHQDNFSNVICVGMMGMATFIDDENLVRSEFLTLKNIFDQYAKTESWEHLSMGMSGDYPIALESGSNMLRIGSLLFED